MRSSPKPREFKRNLVVSPYNARPLLIGMSVTDVSQKAIANLRGDWTRVEVHRAGLRGRDTIYGDEARSTWAKRESQSRPWSGHSHYPHARASNRTAWMGVHLHAQHAESRRAGDNAVEDKVRELLERPQRRHDHGCC